MTRALTPGNPAVRFDGVEKRATQADGSETLILRGISGTVPAGAIITLVGPSAAGKSTLLSMCNALDSPSGGTVEVLGRPVSTWDVQALRQRVGLVFQTPTVLPGTVADNLSAPLKLHHQPIQGLERYLEQVSLPASLLTRDAAELSGGQKQRVALARTLANSPQILLLDEVTSALDVAAVQGVEETIREIHCQEQVTMIWVTHDLAQAQRVGEWVWLLVDGKLVEVTRTDEFFDQPRTETGRRFLAGDL